jgi:hypothetical protein
MPKYKVAITVPTQWVAKVEADSEEDAVKKAMELDAPPELSYLEDAEDEWKHEIYEWPNGSPDDAWVEEVEE